MLKRPWLVALLLLCATAGQAAWEEPPVLSTEPIGSSYYRHLAHETNIDIRELVKFEKRGFGRTEINILILISSPSVQGLKDLGNRRIKDHVPLETLVHESGRDFDAVYAEARQLKSKIEAMGDNDLPPPVFEVAVSTPTAITKKTKEKGKTKENSSEKKETPATTPDELFDPNSPIP